MPVTINAFNHAKWERHGLKDYADFTECVTLCDQSEYGDGQLEGEWFFIDDEPLPNGRRVIYHGSFGNDNAPGASMYTHAEIFDGGDPASVIQTFMAFDINFTGGVFVSAGLINSDNKADVVVGRGAGGPPDVKVFSGADRSLLLSFQAYAAGFPGGVTVGVLSDPQQPNAFDIVTGAGPGGGPHVRVFDSTGTQLPGAQASFFASEPEFAGGVSAGGG